MTYDCDDFRTFGGGIISGLLSTEDDGLIRDVMVDLTNSGVPGMMTNEDGEYQFPAMPFGSQYEVIPNKDGDDFNGISTADIVAIQRHLLGKQELNSPYKLIAADVNKSDFVSAADISELRKFILGLYNELPNNTSWRFVDESYSFPDPMNPWEEVFPETYDITGFDSDMQIDFVGVKIGDVNGDVDLSGFGNNSPRSLRKLKMEDGEISDGNTYEVVLTMDDLGELSGYQFTLEWNTEYLELMEVMPNLALDMRLNNFGLNRIEEGVITTSWNRTNEDRIDHDEERLFVLRFRGLQKGKLSELMTVSSQITKKEAYVGQDFATEDLELEFVGGAENRYFALYQNEPNPWSNRTLISFHLPSDQVASLTIFDENGRAVKTIDGEFTRGHNEVEINQDDLQGSGLLYYRLETRDHTATRKMILIE